MVLGFADEMKKLGENIAGSCNVRIGEVKDIIKGTRSTLRNFHTDRLHMSEEQRAELERFKKGLMEQTHAMLNEFKNNFEKMAQELHSMLSGYYKGEIKKPVHAMLGKFHSEMNALADEFHKAHDAWMSFSRSMSAKRHMKSAPEAMESSKPRRSHTAKRAGTGTKKRRKASRKK